MSKELWDALYLCVFYLMIAGYIIQGGVWLVRKIRSLWLEGKL